MVLIDSNVAYWTLVEEGRLGRFARERMTAAQACYVSALTVVEFRIKEMKGKLHVPSGLVARLSALGFESLEFSAAHADALLQFPSLAGHDPFDRMLVAQAKADGLDFLTADRTLLALGEPWILDATR